MHDTAIPPALAANQEKYTPQALALPTFWRRFCGTENACSALPYRRAAGKKLNLTVSCF